MTTVIGMTAAGTIVETIGAGTTGAGISGAESNGAESKPVEKPSAIVIGHAITATTTIAARPKTSVRLAQGDRLREGRRCARRKRLSDGAATAITAAPPESSVRCFQSTLRPA